MRTSCVSFRAGFRWSAFVLVAGLSSTACLDQLLEAPYVLTTGLPKDAKSLAPTAAHTMLVAGPAGVLQIDGSGQVIQVTDRPTRAALGHRDWTALVDDQGVTFGQLTDGRWAPGSTTPLTGTLAAQAWCDDQLLILTPGALSLVKPGDPSPRFWAAAPAGAVDLGLAPQAPGGSACDAALVLTDTTIQQVSSPPGTAPSTIVVGLDHTRTLALDRLGQIWVVHGKPAVLSRIVDGQPQVGARHVGDVVDMHFGTGELWHGDNAYLLTSQGRLDYVHLAVAAPASTQ